MQNKLLHGLSLIDAIAIVVGTIVGTGIFLKTAIMANYLHSPVMVLLVWVVAGLLSLSGALTYAELSALFPRAGGEYIFLKEAYGDLTAFLYGWTRFLIASPASIAAFAVGASTFLLTAFPDVFFLNKTFLALFFVVFFSALNCLKVSFGGAIQSFLTILKIVTIAVIPVGVLFFSSTTNLENLATSTLDAMIGNSSNASFTFANFGAAMIAALWAFDGWNNLPMVASEVKDPKKNIPKALIFGTVAILIIYLIINFSYFYALPFSEVLSANSSLNPNALPVATKSAQTFMGSFGIMFLSSAMVLSAIGGMNGSILTNARVPYAMAANGVFFRQFAEVSASTHVPVFSILIQAILSCAFVLTGTFDQLTDYVVFSSWIFYALAAFSLFIFRRRGLISEGYKTFAYPYLPAIFILVSILLLLNTILNSPKETSIGFALIVVGIPVFLYLKSRSSRSH